MSAVEQASAQLAKAEVALAAAKRVAEREDARADRYTIDDPGAVSGIRRKPNRRADDRRFNSYHAAAAAHETLRRAEAEVDRWRREVEWQTHAEETRAAITPERLKAATFVRTRWGWERVVRVSAKSVTVKGAWPFDDRRVPLADVVEVRP